jgi:hypothetical protein
MVALERINDRKGNAALRSRLSSRENPWCLGQKFFAFSVFDFADNLAWRFQWFPVSTS